MQSNNLSSLIIIYYLLLVLFSLTISFPNHITTLLAILLKTNSLLQLLVHLFD